MFKQYIVELIKVLLNLTSLCKLGRNSYLRILPQVDKLELGVKGMFSLAFTDWKCRITSCNLKSNAECILYRLFFFYSVKLRVKFHFHHWNSTIQLKMHSFSFHITHPYPLRIKKTFCLNATLLSESVHAVHQNASTTTSPSYWDTRQGSDRWTVCRW